MASTSNVKWTGDLESGEGKIETGSGTISGTYSAASRFADGAGTNPEELLAAAHASCFSMALTLFIGEAGHDAQSVETDAKVYLRRDDDGFTIHKIALSTVASVPGIDQDELEKMAGQAKDQCPLSKALASVPEITLEARLAG
jgi:osmotically inducible protein OsmC